MSGPDDPVDEATLIALNEELIAEGLPDVAVWLRERYPDASEEHIAQSFTIAARHAVCRGFAIGRTIFGPPAREWLAGNIDDATATVGIAQGYERMIEAWRRARPAMAAA